MDTTNYPLNDADSAFPQKAKALLSRKIVLARVSLSNSAMYEMICRGEFPAPIQLSARRVGWLESEIDAWIETRIAASRKAIA